ncbi:FMN-binding protein [Lutibacter sp.]
MKQHIFFIGLLFLMSFSSSDRVSRLIDKEIKSVFNIVEYQKEAVLVSEEINKALPTRITKTNFYKITTIDEKHIGYYFLGKAFGKTDYFDFLVILNNDFVISKIKVLVYREDHGSEVGSKRWLRQFTGKSTKHTFKYQDDIAAISGATISAKSMTREINKFLKTIEILIQKHQL